MRSLVLQTTSGFLLGLLSVLSVFMLLRGHDAPGGGFVGGLLLAAGFALRSLSHGPAAARRALPAHPRTFVGAGLLVAVVAACAGMIAGQPLLAPLWAGRVPGLGSVGTVVLFDLGVYLVVAGTALTILLTLAEEDP